VSTDLDPLLKRLHLANTRRVWRDLVQRAEKEEWSFEAFLQTLVAEEIAHRRGTRLSRALRAAAFPFLRTIEEFDFAYQSTLRLTTVGSLLTPDFVTEGHSVILEGKPGRGKTHLAIAIAYRAMQNGFDALFTTAAQLIDNLSTASRDGNLRETLALYMKPHVLVVDEVGYLACGDDAANVLYHVVNDRNIRRRAMIFTTNKHPRRWGPVLHDDDLAEAIVDRVLERGRLLRLDGPSLRTKHLPEHELDLDDQDTPGGSRVSGKQVAEFPERTTELQEMMPVLVRPGETGHLDTEDDTHMIERDLGEQALEAFAADGGAARHSEIVVDDEDALTRPSHLLGEVDEAVLQLRRFLISVHLRHRRLPDVHGGQSIEMTWADLLRPRQDLRRGATRLRRLHVLCSRHRGGHRFLRSRDTGSSCVRERE
jgi:DNA replication protein DnaC